MPILHYRMFRFMEHGETAVVDLYRTRHRIVAEAG